MMMMMMMMINYLLDYYQQLDLNEMSYWEDTCKLEFNVEKCKVQHMESNNIKDID